METFAAAGQGLGAVVQAVDEMVGFEGQGFVALQLWGVHIADPILDLHVIEFLLGEGEVDARIVDFDLFVGVGAVVNDHLQAPADQGLADLDRGSSAHVDVGDDFGGHLNGNGAIWVRCRCRSNGCRWPTQPPFRRASDSP